MLTAEADGGECSTRPATGEVGQARPLWPTCHSHACETDTREEDQPTDAEAHRTSMDSFVHGRSIHLQHLLKGFICPAWVIPPGVLVNLV